MPRRKIIEPEILPPEDDQHTHGRKKMVEAEHTIRYSAPVPVTVEESPDEELNIDDDIVEEKPRRKPKNERDELRKKLAQNNVTPASQLKLSVERYLHSDSAEGGTWAEAEFLTKYACTEAHITNEDYLDVARKWGAGTYRFTLRMKNIIVTAWDKRLGVITHTIQNAIPGDPNSPPVILQGDGQQPIGQVMAMKDIMKAQKEAFKEQLEMAKLLREAYGLTPDLPATAAVITDPKIAALQLIAENPDVMEKIGSGIAKTVLGSKVEGDSDPWAEVAKEAIKSGQAAEIVSALVREFMAPFRNLWGNNNGQAQMAQAPLQNQQTEQAQVPLIQGQQEGADSHQQNAPGGFGSTELPQGVQNQPQTRPEDPYTQMMTNIITTLAANGSVEDAVKRVNGFLLFNPAYAQVINDQFSPNSEQLLGAIATIPGCAQIAQAPHAKQWIEQFQSKFFVEGEGEEE